MQGLSIWRFNKICWNSTNNMHYKNTFLRFQGWVLQTPLQNKKTKNTIQTHAFKGQDTLWNISFKAFDEIRIWRYTFWSISSNIKTLKIDCQNFLYRERLFCWTFFHAWLILLLPMTSAKLKRKYKHNSKKQTYITFFILKHLKDRLE